MGTGAEAESVRADESSQEPESRACLSGVKTSRSAGGGKAAKKTGKARLTGSEQVNDWMDEERMLLTNFI